MKVLGIDGFGVNTLHRDLQFLVLPPHWCILKVKLVGTKLNRQMRIIETKIRNYLEFVVFVGQITAPDEVAVSGSTACNLFVNGIQKGWSPGVLHNQQPAPL